MTDDTSYPDVPSLQPPTRTELLSFLQAMYKEQSDQARQHETMRQQATEVDPGNWTGS